MDDAQRHPAPGRRWRLAALGAFGFAGALFVTTSLNANGLDLRESSVTDLDHVVRAERERVADLQRRVAAVDADVKQLSSEVDDRDVRRLQRQVATLHAPAGFTGLQGPGLTVVLDDVPRDRARQLLKADPELVPDELVVHQQDIQAVVNALWAGGAEAMSIKDVRIISTTGIRCVGNVVILHGVPYSPPYTIRAIGDPAAMRASLASNDYVSGIVRAKAEHGLGYEIEDTAELRLPAFTGSATLKYAEQGDAPPAR